MNCEDIRNAIYVYLDGEFARPEEAAFERHLDDCSECRIALEAERTFLKAFRSELTSSPAPEALRQAVVRELQATPAGTSAPATQGKLWLPLAAAACIAAVVVLAVDRVNDSSDAVVEEAIAAHQSATK